ncbi:MAG: hypothetical protein ACE367_24475 [Acidimicrobiales bacterium]
MFDVLAHGVGLRGEVPFEAWPVAWAIVVVVVVAFVVVTRRPPDFADAPAVDPAAADGDTSAMDAGVGTDDGLGAAEEPDALGPIGLFGRAVGLVGLGLVLAAGAFGSTVDGATVAPVLVWVVAWAWLPILAVFLGDPWPHLGPFDTLARVVGAPAQRSDPAPVWSHWLAPVAMAVFVAVELTHPDANSAQLIAGLVGAYTLVAVVGAWWWGRAWLAEAETMAVYLRGLGSLAPLQRDPAGGGLRLGRPFRAVALDPTPAQAVTYVVALGALTWDGVGASTMWRDFIGPAEGWADAGWRLLGLADVTAVLAVAALLAARLVADVAGRPVRVVAPALAPVLLPLIAGAAVARLGQVAADGLPALLRGLSDPLGDGNEFLGGLATALDETWLDADPVAWVQVFGVVLGAAGAVVVGDRCVRRLVGSSALDVMRAQYGVVFFVAVSSVATAWFLLV